MTLEDVARDCNPMCGTPDTDVLKVILKDVYLVTKYQKDYLDEISDFASGAYDHRRGGTMRPRHTRFS